MDFGSWTVPPQHLVVLRYHRTLGKSKLVSTNHYSKEKPMVDHKCSALIDGFFKRNSFTCEELDAIIALVKKQCKSDDCRKSAQNKIKAELAIFNLKKPKGSVLQMSRRERVKSSMVLSIEDRLLKLLLNARISKAAVILKIEEGVLIDHIQRNSGLEFQKTSRLKREVIVENANWFIEQLETAKAFDYLEYEKKSRKKPKIKGGNDAWGRLSMAKNIGPLIYIRSK